MAHMQGKTIYIGEAETLKVDSEWAAEVEKRDTAIASSSWEGTPTLSAEALAGTLASALIQSTSNGCVQNIVVLDNGETLARRWEVRTRC